MTRPTDSVWTLPSTPSIPLPERTQVVVIGGGLTGMATAGQLQEDGAEVVVLEAKPTVAGGMATRGMGVASVLLLDPPFRLVEALGLETAKDVLRFSTEGVAAWGDAIDPTGVAYATKGDQEHAEVERNLEAMEALGVAATPWTPSHAQGLQPGWHQPQGGGINLATAAQAMSRSLRVATGMRAVSIEDDGMDLVVRTAQGECIRADLVVMTGGAQITPWAQDKYHTVRHQSLATEPVEPLFDAPVHIQYGYTSVRQHPEGQLLISGCRWATPHLEIGETDDHFVHPDVHARLLGFLHQHWPSLASAAVTHQWSAIMNFSCDGLPIIGPLPGRQRIITCGGFGAYSPSLALRAARAVAEGILTSQSQGVPSCFSTRRFD